MTGFRNTVLAAAVVLLGCAMPALATAQTDKHRFEVDRTPPTAEDAPRTVALGMATINGRLQLPAYLLDVVNGADGRSADRPESLALRTKLDARHATQLALWYTPSGWLLVPRGWQPLKGGVGANGSVSLLFVAPQSTGYLSYYNASACVGCAQHAASAFFPEARKDAQANDFPYLVGTDPPVRSTRLRKHLMAYRATLGAQNIDGIAYYDSTQDLPFFKLEVGLPPAQSALATAILNWRLPPR